MNDARAAVAAQKGLGQQANQVVAFDKAAVLVEEEAAIVVAVPGQAHDRRRVGTARRVASRFSSSIGLGTPFGNEPSG